MNSELGKAYADFSVVREACAVFEQTNEYIIRTALEIAAEWGQRGLSESLGASLRDGELINIEDLKLFDAMEPGLQSAILQKSETQQDQANKVRERMARRHSLWQRVGRAMGRASTPSVYSMPFSPPRSMRK